MKLSPDLVWVNRFPRGRDREGSPPVPRPAYRGSPVVSIFRERLFPVLRWPYRDHQEAHYDDVWRNPRPNLNQNPLVVEPASDIGIVFRLIRHPAAFTEYDSRLVDQTSAGGLELHIERSFQSDRQQRVVGFLANHGTHNELVVRRIGDSFFLS